MAVSEEKKRVFKIAGLGEVLWDVYGDEKYVGGSPANFCAHIAMSGHDACLFARVGDDQAGRDLVRHVKGFNVNVDGIQTDIFKPTGTVKISLDATGRPNYTCTSDVAFDHMRVDSIWEEMAPEMEAVFFGLLAQRGETSREAIYTFLNKANTALKVCDLNIRRWDAMMEKNVHDSLVAADVIKLNKDECRMLKDGWRSDDDDITFLRKLIQKHVIQMAALTLGSTGCYLITQNEEEFDPGYYITPIDSSGAGDAFSAGLVVKILQHAPLSEAADFANCLGAYVSTKKGAVPAWSYAELENFMAVSL